MFVGFFRRTVVTYYVRSMILVDFLALILVLALLQVL